MRGIGVMCIAGVLGHGTARADESQPAAQPTTSDAPPPAPGTAAPTPAAPVPPPAIVGRPLSEHTVDRHGLLLLGGLSSDGDNSSLRVDVIMPVALASAPQLRVGLSGGYDHAAASVPDLSLEGYAFSVGVMALYDWRLPIATAAGDFVVSIEGGPTAGRLYFTIDEMGMTSSTTISAVALHTAGALQYRAHGGFVASVQPLGLSIPIWHSEIDPTFPASFSSDVGWEGALLCGYQFR